MDEEEGGEESSGPRVVLRIAPDGYAVLIEPPLPDGDHLRTFYDKQTAWARARELWCAHRLGLCDETVGCNGRKRPSEDSRSL